MKKILLSVFLLFFLVLIQTSFLVHFDISGVNLNLVLIAVVLVNFFERPWRKRGLVVAAIGGFYLDLFSDFRIGVSVLTLFILALLIKRILRSLKEENILYFIPLFILIFILYGFLLILFGSIAGLTLPSALCFNKLKVLELAYNLAGGTFGFYLVKLCLKVLRR